MPEPFDSTHFSQISRTFLRAPSLTTDETPGQVDQHESDIHAASSFIADFTGHSQRSATRALHPLRAPDRTIHGFAVRDDFRWLEPLESESEEVKAWTDLKTREQGSL